MALYGNFGTKWFNKKMKSSVNIENYGFLKKKLFSDKKGFRKTAILSIDFVSTNCESPDKRLLWVIVMNHKWTNSPKVLNLNCERNDKSLNNFPFQMEA